MKIPFLDLTRNYQGQQKEILLAVKRVFDAGRFILGQEVELFEKEFAEFIGVKEAIACASGTDALTLSLKALEINRDDEVLLPDNCYPTAMAAAQICQVKPVEINPKTLLIDSGGIEKTISKKTKAIIPVHLYGQAVPMLPIMKIAEKHQLFVIEDCAQSHGALDQRKMTGSFGKTGCFSFYPTKNLGGAGDGGMITTNDSHLAKILRQLRMYGENKRYHSLRLGTNSRLDEIQAAILRLKLKKLNFYNQKRIEIAQKYSRELQNLPLVLPEIKTDKSHVYHLFVIQTEKRDRLKNFLQENHVETQIHYPVAVHQIKSLKNLISLTENFVSSQKALQKIISLPCYPELGEKEQQRICSLVKKFFRQ